MRKWYVTKEPFDHRSEGYNRCVDLSNEGILGIHGSDMLRFEDRLQLFEELAG